MRHASSLLETIASMIDTMNWNLLDRYICGECSPDEVEAIERWAARSPARRERLASLRKVWELTGTVPEAFDAHSGWGAIRSKVGRQSRVIAPLGWQQQRAERRARAVALRVAAAIVVAAVTIAGWRWGGAILRHQSSRPIAAARDYVTARGERGTVVLRDGTRVWLNAGSRLRVPGRFGVGARDVFLDGEAAFVVTHNARVPFRVHTTNAVAQDVGTEFVVRAYGEDSSTTAVVFAGAVSLAPAAGRSRRGDDGVTLTRGQLGRVSGAAFLTVEHNVDMEAYRGWQDGRLEFRDVPLADVARELERWYDVRIIVSDSTLRRVPVRATFLNQSLDDVLGIIARSIGGRYARDGQDVRLFVSSARRRTR